MKWDLYELIRGPVMTGTMILFATRGERLFTSGMKRAANSGRRLRCHAGEKLPTWHGTDSATAYSNTANGESVRNSGYTWQLTLL